ncbi:MAG: hypothetical protein KatS3mg108_0245 [Isosphaeraceae bacterium]|jgi:membrane protease YdiL (CAAX protease family)|nr:MAG: hypothetical protein KatS3mg108_0245 [Isosphaeraceae bacterium]
MDEPAPRQPISLTARLAVLAFYAALTALASFLARLAHLHPWSNIHLHPHALALGLLTASPLAAWLVLVLTLNGFGFGHLRRATLDLLRPFFSSLTTLDLLSLSLLAGFVEELLFRGVLQPWAASRWGLPTALLATNLLFAAAHALTPSYAAVAFLIGSYLGAASALTGNLAIPIIAHAAYDALALAALRRTPQNLDLPDPTRP